MSSFSFQLAKKAEERIIKARNFLNKIIDEERGIEIFIILKFRMFQ